MKSINKQLRERAAKKQVKVMCISKKDMTQDDFYRYLETAQQWVAQKIDGTDIIGIREDHKDPAYTTLIEDGITDGLMIACALSRIPTSEFEAKYGKFAA